MEGKLYSRLAPELNEQFVKDVIELAENKVGGRINGHDVHKLLAEKYKAQCCLATVYNNHRIHQS